MELVIDIDEEDYKSCMCLRNLKNAELSRIELAVALGIPLPKNRGRLIDADALIENGCFYETEMDLKNAPTVLAADGYTVAS